MKKTLIAAAVSALFAGHTYAVVDLRPNNLPVTYATTQALAPQQVITDETAKSDVQNIRAVADFGIPAGSVHYLLLRLDGFDARFATMAQPTIDYTTVYNKSAITGRADYDARGDLGDIFIGQVNEATRYVFTGEQVRVTGGTSNISNVEVLSGNALDPNRFAGYESGTGAITDFPAEGNYFLYQLPGGTGAYLYLPVESAFDQKPATIVSFGGNGQSSAVFGVNTQDSGSQRGTAQANAVTDIDDVRINSVPKSASFIFNIDGLIVNGPAINASLSAGVEPAVRATYAVFPANKSLEAQQAANPDLTFEQAAGIFQDRTNTFVDTTETYIKFGEGLTVTVGNDINKEVDVVNEAGELFAINRRDGLRLVNENGTPVAENQPNSSELVNTGINTTVPGATVDGIAHNTLILVEDRDDADARFANIATFNLSVENLRNINGSEQVGSLGTLFNSDDLVLRVLGDFSARTSGANGVQWTATNNADPSTPIAMGTPSHANGISTVTIPNGNLATTNLSVAVRYNVTGNNFIDPAVVYSAVALQGTSEILNEELSAFGANATSRSVDLALNPEGVFRNFIRITNPTQAAGAVSIDVYNDAGDMVNINLQDIEGFTSSTIRANQSTRQINISEIYDAAVAKDATFAVQGEGTETAGTVVGNKLRLVVHADLGDLSVQAISVSRDSQSFSTF